MDSSQGDDREPTMICEECGKPSYVRVIAADGRNVCERCAAELEGWPVLDFVRRNDEKPKI